MIDKEKVKTDFINGVTIAAIAKEMQVSRQRIHQVVRNYKNYGRKRRERFYKDMGKCEECKIHNAEVLHHKDLNNSNDTPENLEKLCRNCHTLRHGAAKYEPMKKIEGQEYCYICKYSWVIRVNKPRFCPRCHRANYFTPQD